ncbi:MAG: hypothetical protein L0Z53_03870, partial [Acidobacteriales bacterium]|nr:hypothetical protein [Terriglobales bacterium]
MPNDPNAVRNEYVAQVGDCEILKKWKTRYTAPAGVTDVTWWYIQAAGDIKFGDGSPYEETVNINSYWKAYYKGKKDGSPVTSGFRWVSSGEVESPAGTPGFDLTKDGKYSKLGFWAKPPILDDKGQVIKGAKSALYFSGQVDLKIGSVALTSFQWGFIQRIYGKRRVFSIKRGILAMTQASKS